MDKWTLNQIMTKSSSSLITKALERIMAIMSICPFISKFFVQAPTPTCMQAGECVYEDSIYFNGIMDILSKMLLISNGL